ncbi:MAG: Fic family protein [Alphaproteobacteria bacterium]|nr:Fic family protein [Alphaproteobacteria bacterium]
MPLIINIEHLTLSPTCLALIDEIDAFKSNWRMVDGLVPEQLGSLRKVAVIESIGSSTRIEGSKLSDEAVEDLLARLEIQSFASRDEEEVASYAETMNLIFDSWSEITLTENHIKQLHRDVLRHSIKDEHHRGNYKTLPNHVAAFDENGREIGIVFATSSPFDTPHHMSELVAWLSHAQTNKTHHPLILIGIFIVVFLAIHPFQDGNGRLSRLLTTMMLMQAGYGYVPYSSLEHVIEQRKESYYRALRQTQSSLPDTVPDWLAWLEFFLGAMQQQARRLFQQLTAQNRMLSLPPVSGQIMALVKRDQRVTIGSLHHATALNRNTIKDHLRRLVETQQLQKHGTGKGTWYTLPLRWTNDAD